MPESFEEAFPGGFEECVRTLGAEDSVDDPEALCGWLQENGMSALSRSNPDDVLVSLEVEYVSVVDEPAQDSEWLVAKSADADPDEFDPADDPLRGGEFVVDKQAEEPERKVWAAVLIPGEVDKQGDLVPEPEIERAAHNYLKHYRKVDEDHDLVDGSGEPIESYVLKQETTFDLPGSGSGDRTYPAGTWIMGVQLDEEAWKRVESGDLTGFSIYGGAASLDPGDLLTETQKEVLLGMDGGDGETVEKQPEEDPCWDGYVMVGTKPDEFGNEVPRCVPEEEASVLEHALQEKAVDPDNLLDAYDAYLSETGDDPADVTAVEFVEWVQENPDYDDPDAADDEEGESDGMDEDDDRQESSNKSETPGNGGDSDGDGATERDKENMGEDNPDDDEAQDDKLDELLEKMDSTAESVEETRKSVESVRDRVDALESEVYEKAEGDDEEGEEAETDTDDAGDDLDAEEVEEVAADAAEKAAESVLKSAFAVDEEAADEDADLSEVVRKGEAFPDPNHDEDDGDEASIELDYSGVVAGGE